MLNLHPRSHIDKEQFLSLKMLPVANRVDHLALCHVFKISSNTAPAYMSEHFTTASSVHNYPTRFRSKIEDSSSNLSDMALSDSKRFAVPKVKGFGMKTFAYKGCTLWNSLPQHARDAKTMSSFKYKVKEHFFQIM